MDNTGIDTHGEEIDRVGPFDVARSAMLVVKYLTTGRTTKKHGGYKHYQDRRLWIRLDTYVPNLDIQVMVDGKREMVYSAAYNSHASPQIYRRGKWVSYLKNVLLPKAEKAEKEQEKSQHEKDERERKRRYTPVDDAALFEDVN